MNKTKQQAPVQIIILPRGNNPIQKVAIQPSKATQAMNEAFNTYFHPGVLQRGQTQTEE